MNRRLIWMVAVAVMAIACSKKDKSEQTETSTAARDTVASAPASVAYRAFGNEPFWSVTIDATGLHFISPDDTVGMHFGPVEPMAMGDTLHWFAQSDRGALDVRIWPGQCSDGMSDKTHAYASGVRLNDMMYIGCAETTSGSPQR